MNFSVPKAVNYIFFSFFLFYQQLHLKNFRGSSQWFSLILGISSLFWMVYGYGFIALFAYKVGLLDAAILFLLSMLIKFVWFPIEAKLGLHQYYWMFSLLGFFVLPATGYFMYALMPQGVS